MIVKTTESRRMAKKGSVIIVLRYYLVRISLNMPNACNS
jgi:hypothetical protein